MMNNDLIFKALYGRNFRGRCNMIITREEAIKILQSNDGRVRGDGVREDGEIYGQASN